MPTRIHGLSDLRRHVQLSLVLILLTHNGMAMLSRSGRWLRTGIVYPLGDGRPSNC